MEPLLHEEYNTKHEISAIPDGIRPAVWGIGGEPEVQSVAVVHLLWRKRWDGSQESLQCLSRRPHAHPNQHTEEELKQIRNMRRRNPDLGIIELWCRLRERGYSRCVESLYRVMKREGFMPQKKKGKKYVPKPYEQMTHPGERVQIDVKVVPRKCIANPELRLYQYTAIDEYSRYRVLGAYPEQSTYSSTDFLKKVVLEFTRKGIEVECVQTDNGLEFTNRFSTHRNKPTLFEETLRQLGISTVMTDIPMEAISSLMECDSVTMENVAGFLMLVQRLASTGTKKIGFVGDNCHCGSFGERWAGFMLGLKTFGLQLDENLCVCQPDTSS